MGWREVMVLGFACALPGCGGGGDDGGGSSYTIASGRLSGLLDGQPWVLGSAESSEFLSEGEADFWVDMYAESKAACDDPPPVADHLIVFVPKTPGDYSLSLALNATFVVGTDNLVATRGRIVVDEVTSAVARGGAHIEYDADNSVSGSFEVTICSD
jgi:hypothetical protein